MSISKSIPGNDILAREIYFIGKRGICSMSLHSIEWYGCCVGLELDISNLTDNDLILYYKGLVIAETELMWKHGSATHVKELYKEIVLRKLDIDLSLANWGIRHSTNPYIPFGFTRCGNNAYEQVLKEIIHTELIRAQKAEKHKRYLDRMRRAEVIAKEKMLRTKAIREHYSMITVQNIEDQAKYILCDNSRNFYYYRPIIEQILETENVSVHILRSIRVKICSLKDTRLKRNYLKRIDCRILQKCNI